jgi:hypothetical protein
VYSQTQSLPSFLRGMISFNRQPFVLGLWVSSYLLHLSRKCQSSLLFVSVSQTAMYSVLYTGCPGRKVPDFGRIFLQLKYTDITQNTYIRSWTVTEIMAREKYGLLAVPCTVPGSRDVLSVHCACPSFSLQPAQAILRCDCTCKVLGTLRTTATLARVFMWFNWMALCHSYVN